MGLPPQIADHPRNCDLYMYSLTYAYNFEPHKSTTVLPCVILLTKATGTPAQKPMPTSEERKDDFNLKWKLWIQGATEDTSERLAKAQARCKKNYDARLRKRAEVIDIDDYEYPRVERNDPNYSDYHLAPVAEGA